MLLPNSDCKININPHFTFLSLESDKPQALGVVLETQQGGICFHSEYLLCENRWVIGVPGYG